jgi:hypothetical protein
MTKYSEIAEMPDGNKLFIHYEEEQYPVWIEYVNTKTNRSVKFDRRRKAGTQKIQLRKIYNKTRKLSCRANSFLPADGTW